MNKEEILEKHCIGKTNTWLKSTVDNIERAMDEYAKQDAIDFAEFVSELEHSHNSEDNIWDIWTPEEYKGQYTTEQLYELYLKEKE